MKEQIKANKLSIEPWNLSLEERLRLFEDAEKKNKKIALYFVKGPDSSTFRYRCFNPYQATLASKKWQAIFFFKSEMKTIERLIPRASLVILGRQSRWDGDIRIVVEAEKKSGLKVLFDLDDLVFDKKYLSVFVSHGTKDYFMGVFYKKVTCFNFRCFTFNLKFKRL